MSGLYEELVYRIRGEVSDLDRLVQKALRVWSRVQKPEMAEEMTNVRPAVISPERIVSLDHLRRFRHLVRNVYTFNLSQDKLKSLMADLPGLWLHVQAELLAFADFLSELSRPNQT